MMEIKKIGKPECKIIRKELELALGAALEDLGLKADFGNMTFSGNKVTTKLTVSVADYNAQKEEFDNACYKYGLTPENYRDSFESNGERYELVGIKPRSHKYPFVGKRASDGKKYKFGKFILSQLLDNAA